jgi:short-subunit dehydrogenase
VAAEKASGRGPRGGPRAPRMEGSVALVTGASSGIGRETALLLARLGATVIAVGRNEPALAEISEITRGPFLVADLAAQDDLSGVVPRAVDACGRVDILVNGAGIGWAGELPGVEPPLLGRMVSVNLTAPMVLAAAVLPGMLGRGSGHILNVASIVGFTGNREETAYSATKAGLIGFTRSLRQELAGTGVRVSMVVPGVIDTPFFTTRGRPYARSWPRPLHPCRVASAIVSAITRDRREVFVPAWMRLPAELAAAAPGLYSRLAARFG